MAQGGREEIRGRSLYASRFGIHPQGDVGRPRPLGGGVHGHTAAQEVFRQSANTKDTRSERLRSDAPANRNEVGLVTKNIHLAQVGWEPVCVYLEDLLLG